MTAASRWMYVPVVLSLGGGLLIASGALLPWLTLYGGLHRYLGVSGLYGWVMLVLGAAAVLLALRDGRKARPAISATLIGLGLSAGLLAATRLSHTYAMVADGSAVMLVPAVGPGLLVALLGSLLLAAGGLTRLRRR